MIEQSGTTIWVPPLAKQWIGEDGLLHVQCPERGHIRSFEQVEALFITTCISCGEASQVEPIEDAEDEDEHDDEEVETVVFNEGEQRKVLTSVSEQCAAGHCMECPGVLQVEGVEERVFCVHGCHRVQ